MLQNQLTFEQVVKRIISALEDNLQVVIQAAKDAHFAATHSESIAETKYDTFGLESSYLAQGQQKRVDEVNQSLAYFLQIAKTRRQCVQTIEPPCLVSLENEKLQRHFFVAPFAGGLTVEIEQTPITVVTRASPVGQSLLGKMLDDEVSITFKGKVVDFEVVRIE